MSEPRTPEKDADLSGETAHVGETGCGLTRQDFHSPHEEPCVNGGRPVEHPCERCGGDLTRLGTCCWPDLCGDCEDANQTEMDAAR